MRGRGEGGCEDTERELDVGIVLGEEMFILISGDEEEWGSCRETRGVCTWKRQDFAS